MPPPPPSPHPATSGVIGAAGRYPLHERPALPLVLAGAEVLPVGPLRMYTCGITPYDVAHVGHASAFVWADVVASLAHATGSEPLVARNVTDVDDVLTKAARTRGWDYDELALTQEYLLERDMKALAVAPPTITPHARAHVATTIRLASALLRRNAAYESAGHIYFRGARLPAQAGLDEATALALLQEYGDQADAPDREGPFDVPVWRPSTEDHPAWPSPWGWGRPGWHAECAAMALCSLGPSVDVLLGGVDLTFPHHAYQAAMVAEATGVQPFSRAVIHVGEVRREGGKMAKSTGNLVLISDLLSRHAGETVRLGLLHRPWREPWDCQESVFDAAGETLGQLRSAAGPAADLHPRPVHRGVLEALANDLDVPAAVRVALDQGGVAAASLLALLKLG